MSLPMAVPQKTLIVALAMIILAAAAAAFILAGPGGPAQAAQDTPAQTQPEACSDTPVAVYGKDDGAKRLALFDVYWDTEEKYLFNNPCPPTVTHYPEEPGPGRFDPPIPARDLREQSTVDVRETIIHIPNSYKRTLTYGSTDHSTKYPFMFEDWNVEDSDNDGTNDALVTDTLWVLPTCDPSYTDAQNTANPARAGANDLCLIFSAALLNPNNWVDKPKGTAAGDVEYLLESIREPGIEAADRGVVFAFHPYNDIPVGSDGEAEDQATWRTDGTHENALAITPGTYEYRQWGFTRPGTYVFQLHVLGYPRRHDVHGEVIDTRTSTASEVIRYTFHVGLLAELNTRVAADSTTPDVGDTVTLTITARNEGPSEGDDVEVQVGLPAGLTYVSDTTAAGSYDNATGVWSVGTMAKPAPGVAATEATLTITATVDSGTRGEALEVTASISGTETIGGSEVGELDPHGEEVHHAASVTITPTATTNAPVELYLRMDVPENSAAGTAIGQAIPIRGVDHGDIVDAELVGTGSDLFSAGVVGDTVQIEVAAGANLDFEWGGETVYDLKLQVNDGFDHEGNVDTTPDSEMPVQINVTDVRTEDFAVRLFVSNTQPTVGDSSVVFTVVLDNDPTVPIEDITWTFNERYDAGSQGYLTNSTSGTGDPGTTLSPPTVPTEAGVRQYWIVLGHTDDTDTYVRLAESLEVDVDWQADNSSPGE